MGFSEGLAFGLTILPWLLAILPWLSAFRIARLNLPGSFELIYFIILSLTYYIITIRLVCKHKYNFWNFWIVVIVFPIIVPFFLFLDLYFFSGFLSFVLGLLIILGIIRFIERNKVAIKRNLRAYIVSSIYQKIEISKDNQSYTYNSDEETKITSDINAKLTSIEEIIKKLKIN